MDGNNRTVRSIATDAIALVLLSIHPSSPHTHVRKMKLILFTNPIGPLVRKGVHHQNATHKKIWWWLKRGNGSKMKLGDRWWTSPLVRNWI